MGAPKSVIEADEAADKEIEALIAQRDGAKAEEVEAPEPALPKEEPPVIESKPQDEYKPEEDPNSETWQTKYQTLQGMIKAEARQYKSELGKNAERIAGLESQIKELMGRKPEPVREITPDVDLVDAFGSEAADKISKFWGKKEAELRREFEEKIQPFQSKVAEVEVAQGKTAEARYFELVGLKVPDWNKINNDAKFSDWLDANGERFSGYTYRQVLNNAHSRHDASTVAEIFNAFKNDAKPDTSREEERKKDLESQLAPGKGKGGNVPSKDEPQIYSMRTIEKFYEDARKGKYFGKDAEADKLERLYDLAVSEGRVTN